MRRIAVVFGTVAIVLAAASPAWAHVTVSPTEAPQGSDAVLTFTVPNEMDNATTVKLQVKFPDGIAEALTSPVAGWTAKVATKTAATPIKTDSGQSTEEVDTVTWTASGAGVAVGQFQNFQVSIGLPDSGDSLLFPAIQTYSNGQTVQWVETTPPGGTEPDHPAPVLKLTAGEEAGSTTPTTAANGSAAAASSTKAAKQDDVDTAKTIGIIALIVAIVGGALGIAAFVVARRRPATKA